MKFTVNPQDLKTAYDAVKRVLTKNAVMPVIDNILILPAGENKVTFTATDIDNTITVGVDVTEAEGVIPTLIPSKHLGDFIANGLGGFDVTIEVSAGDIKFSDPFGEFTFYADLDAKEFPQKPTINNEFEVSVEAARFIEITNSALRFVGNDDNRPVMGGVCCDFNEQGLFVVATDSKTMFCDVMRDVKTSEQRIVILNRRVVSALAAICNTSDNIVVSCDNNQVKVSQGLIEICGRLIEGRYPRYQQVIPRNNDKIAALNRNLFTGAIRRALVGANSATNQIVLSFNGRDNVTLKGKDIDNSTSAKVSLSTESQDNIPDNFRIGLRGPFLIDIINTFPKSVTSVTLLMLEPARAVLVKSDKDSDRTCLIMPMQIID